jgi:hypothetical protein
MHIKLGFGCQRYSSSANVSSTILAISNSTNIRLVTTVTAKLAEH